MDLSQARSVRAVAALLLVTALTQSIYTALYLAKLDVPRQLLWGSEGVLFAVLAALAAAAMVRADRLRLVFAAIACAAVLNCVQVGVGLTLFFPFSDAAKADPALTPLAGAVVALAFFIYNAAKVLLALAAIVLGLAQMDAKRRVLGALTVLAGGLAMIFNGLSMALGRDGLGELPLAGGSGVLVTLLLALGLLLLPATVER